MPEIIVRQIAFGSDGGPANLDRGIELPIDNETLDRTMMCMKVKYPYIAHSYSFRLDGLNTYLIWSSGSGQPFVTLDREESPTIPPTTPPEEEGNPNTHTEVTTETSTRTEVRSNTTYEYSDAIGQITIAKRDNEGKSLDGAIFNIQIEFANGERGGDSAFEVYNGATRS